jgi:hypothetical protein
MLRSFLFPILLSLSFALLQVAASRSKGMPSESYPEFRFSRGLQWFLLGGNWALIAVLLAIDGANGRRSVGHLVVVVGIAIFGSIVYIYSRRYVLKFWDDHLSVGAFRPKSIYYKDILSAEMSTTSSGSRFLIIETSTRRTAISGYLSLVDDAARLLQSKLSRDWRAD